MTGKPFTCIFVNFMYPMKIISQSCENFNYGSKIIIAIKLIHFFLSIRHSSNIHDVEFVHLSVHYYPSKVRLILKLLSYSEK